VSVVQRGFVPLLVLALTAVLTFLMLPVVAVFLDVPPGRLLDELRSDVALDALRVTAKTNLIANALILGFGTPAAYLLATRRFRGRSLVVTLLELPLVLPPAVAGIGLIAAFGSLGLVGGRVELLGVQVGTPAAVVLAVTFVASPFYLRGAIAAFEAVDRSLLDAARTLGSSQAGTFFRVALPLASAGLGAGAALAFARGIGEFGATIMFAGSLQGVTQTFSLAIYEQFDVDFDVALAISSLLIVVSGALLLAVKIVPSWARSGWISPLGFARSSSS
jgi:molybdate transport system permease protein